MEPCGPREEVGLQRRHDQAVGQEGGEGAAQDLQEDRVQRVAIINTRVGHHSH